MRKDNNLESFPFQLRHAKLESAYKWKRPRESRGSSGPLSVSANYRSPEVDPPPRMRVREGQGSLRGGDECYDFCHTRLSSRTKFEVCEGRLRLLSPRLEIYVEIDLLDSERMTVPNKGAAFVSGTNQKLKYSLAIVIRSWGYVKIIFLE